ncbi:MAG: serine hydrolase domain-containing protein [Flavobacteriaceae bacterium]
MGKTFFMLIGLFSFAALAQEDVAVKLSMASDVELHYADPSEVNLDANYMNRKVDSIMVNAIKNQAFPGAQILVAKDSKIIFHRAYGFHTYDSLQPVALDDLYDLASVTKIMGPLPAIMKLVDENKLKLDIPFSTYWKPWRRVANKKDLTLREILAHQAGLTPYIVFLDEVIRKNGAIKKRFVRTKSSPRFKLEAYDGLYVRNNFNETMYKRINRSVVGEKKYLYSGSTFLIFPKLIEQLTGQSYESYLNDNFYAPLNTNTLVFRPKTKNFANKIVPTEMDTLFRHALTQNWVHDENASLLGGISGNAGLFANAIDLAKMMQMYMQYGSYGGKQYITAETVKEFNTIHYRENENRRGLGFDKPLLGNDTLKLKDAYPAPQTSAESFGHSGFTGTFVWADPNNGLVFIFLSNRVYPSRAYSNLYALNIRTELQSVFYTADLPTKY